MNAELLLSTLGIEISPRLKRVFQVYVCCPCCGPCNGYGHVLPGKYHQAEQFEEVLEARRGR